MAKHTGHTPKASSQKDHRPSTGKEDVTGKSATSSAQDARRKKMAATAAAAAKKKLPLKYARIVEKDGHWEEEPTNAEERLEQALIFLSDEGPENCMDFEKKLEILEEEILKKYPTNKEIKYDAKKFRRFQSMVKVHRDQLAAKKGEWFEFTMFPDYYPDHPFLPKRKRAPPKPSAPIEVEDEEHPEAGPAEGLVEYSRSPWAEKLPRSEVWHHNLPPYFPFGDTPYMDEAMSQQIHDDLDKTGTTKKPTPSGWIKTTLNSMVDFFTGKPKDWNKAPWASPWAMREVDERDVEQAVKEWKAMQKPRRKAPASKLHPGLKRPLSSGVQGSASKRSQIGGQG